MRVKKIFMSLVLVMLVVVAVFPETVSASAAGMPLYLFSDFLFWIFVVMHALVFGGLVYVLSYCIDGKRGNKCALQRKIQARLWWIVAVAIALQVGHYIEHVAQVYQYWILGLPRQEALGILWFANIEWNHFIFNALYFALLVYMVWLLIHHIRRERRVAWLPDKLLLGSVLLLQGWHTIEHEVRLIRHLDRACEPCAGIVDSVFGIGLINLHYWYNTLALLLPLVVFAVYLWPAFLKQFNMPSVSRFLSVLRART